MGSKGYFNPRLKRISPAWVAAKNAVKQKLKFKGGDQVKYSESPANRACWEIAKGSLTGCVASYECIP